MDAEQQKETLSFLSELGKAPDKNPLVSLEYIDLPMTRLRPYVPGVNPIDPEQWPNEPTGWVKVPVVVTPDMSKDDILLAAINYRNDLVNKWLIAGGCFMADEGVG